MSWAFFRFVFGKPSAVVINKLLQIFVNLMLAARWVPKRLTAWAEKADVLGGLTLILGRGRLKGPTNLYSSFEFQCHGLESSGGLKSHSSKQSGHLKR